MPIHQLRATLARPDVDHLVRLKKSHAAYESLTLIAAHHQGEQGPARFRRDLVATQRPHVFPLPTDIEPMLDALFTNIERLFGAVDADPRADAGDDVRVAVFAAWGVTAIHPFDNGNGRTAFDFAQLLLMHRWSLTTPPFALPPDAHQRLGILLQQHDEPSSTWEPTALLQLAQTLTTRFATTRVEDIPGTPLQRIADALVMVRSGASS